MVAAFPSRKRQRLSGTLATPLDILDMAEAEPFDKPVHQPERGPATANAAIPARIIVDVATLITRTDLGANRYTFVAAGDAIPAGLEGFPRNPA
jgi:hypothetical protein